VVEAADIECLSVRGEVTPPVELEEEAEGELEEGGSEGGTKVSIPLSCFDGDIVVVGGEMSVIERK
jgi:hypothetical protein